MEHVLLDDRRLVECQIVKEERAVDENILPLGEKVITKESDKTNGICL